MDMYSGEHEQTVIERIWDIILEVVAIVAKITDIDDEELLELAITNSDRLAAFKMLAKST